MRSFVELPAEIRQMIYKEMLAETGVRSEVIICRHNRAEGEPTAFWAPILAPRSGATLYQCPPHSSIRRWPFHRMNRFRPASVSDIDPISTDFISMPGAQAVDESFGSSICALLYSNMAIRNEFFSILFFMITTRIHWCRRTDIPGDCPCVLRALSEKRHPRALFPADLGTLGDVMVSADMNGISSTSTSDVESTFSEHWCNIHDTRTQKTLRTLPKELGLNGGPIRLWVDWHVPRSYFQNLHKSLALIDKTLKAVPNVQELRICLIKELFIWDKDDTCTCDFQFGWTLDVAAVQTFVTRLEGVNRPREFRSIRLLNKHGKLGVKISR